jgi:PhzF family phenazine biosynthesis protein
MKRPFALVDVFTTTVGLGNPVAVVVDAEGMTTEEMQRFARWMNLSETTFVVEPTQAGADYRARIFTVSAELPFAGHPTLGTCHAWLVDSASDPAGPSTGKDVVQECGAGLIPVRQTASGLAFRAPMMIRQGPVDEAQVGAAAAALGLERQQIVDAQWVDNGPGWAGLLLPDAETVLGVRPGNVDIPIGLIGPYPAGEPCAFEVRAFLPPPFPSVEDPVTGSLNASLAQWLIATGRAEAPYVVSQGSNLGAAGRVHIETDSRGAVWVAGGTITVVRGTVDI